MSDKKETQETTSKPSLQGQEDELKKQLRGIGALLEDSSDLIAVIDPSYSILAVNSAYQQAFYQRYGLQPGEGFLLKNKGEEMPVPWNKELGLWEQALRGEKVRQELMEEGDESFILNGIFKPLAGKDGLTIGAMFVGKQETMERRQQPNSLQDFVLLADAIPQVVWTATPDGTRDFINSWACKYTGAPKKKLLEGSWIQYIHPEDLTTYQAKFQLFVDSKEGFELEYRLRDENGSYRWHLGRGIPIRDHENRIIKFIGTATDIHEHKSLLNRYELKARELEQTMEAIPQIVWTTGADGRVYYFNRQWYQYTGSSPDKSLNDGWLNCLHPDDVLRTREQWQKSLGTGQDFTIEYRLRKSDGNYHWFIGKAVALRNSEGNIIRWFGTCSDIQNQVLQRDELDQKNNKLYQINRYLDEFVHAVAHDLRSPVAGLKLSFELLHQVDEEKQGRILKGCQTYLDRLDNTLKGLVQLIEVQEDSQNQYYAPIDIHQVIDEVVVDLQQKLMDAGAALKFKKLAWRTIAYPKPYIYNILRNIIRYVLRFRDTSSRLTFQVSTRLADNGMMLLEIKDDGPGINLEKESKNLFKPFSHINKGSDQQGMGLAIVKHMLEKNGGKIIVKSTLGKGTKFKLYFKEYSENL